MELSPILAATPPQAFEVFRCEPFDMRLTRGACAGWWRIMNAGAPVESAMRRKLQLIKTCAGCTVGEAHAAGRSAAPTITIDPGPDPHEREPAPDEDALPAEPSDEPTIEVAEDVVDEPQQDVPPPRDVRGRGRFVVDRETHERVRLEGCPSCGIVPTRNKEGRTRRTWARPWVHRCPHGQPCPGASDQPKPSCCPTPPYADFVPPPAATPKVVIRTRPLIELEEKQEETMPQRSNHRDARTCKAHGCATSFVPTHGRQLYCAEHREVRDGSSSSTKVSSAAARKAREDAKVDRMLDAPIATQPKPRKLRELPVRRPRKPAAASASPATTSSTARLEDAQQVLEMSGFEVTGLVRTPAGAVIAIRLGGAE